MKSQAALWGRGLCPAAGLPPGVRLGPRESLRQSYRPERIRLLFIGESPPASGRFFYQRDSGLYRAMRDAFGTVNPALDDQSFLPAFRAAGCYLVDLCPEPVDRLDPASRRAACRAGEEALASKIATIKPPVIATLLRSIEPNVARATAIAKWQGSIIHLPYPGRWVKHRTIFETALTPAIDALFRTPPPPHGSVELHA